MYSLGHKLAYLPDTKHCQNHQQQPHLHHQHPQSFKTQASVRDFIADTLHGRKSRNRAHLLGKGVPCVHNTGVETFSIVVAVCSCYKNNYIHMTVSWEFFSIRATTDHRRRGQGAGGNHCKDREVKSNLIGFGLVCVCNTFKKSELNCF